MNGLDLLMLVLVVGGVLYGAHRLDAWEEERELDWRWEESMRLARESLDEPVLFDQEVA